MNIEQLILELKAAPQSPLIDKAIAALSLQQSEIDNIKQVEFPKRIRNCTQPLLKELTAYRATLEYIANPLKAMTDEAKREGLILNGGMAVTLANNPHHLQTKAKHIIESFPERQVAADGLLNTEEKSNDNNIERYG